MDKLYIVMPAYNEQDNIEAVIEEWYPILKGKGYGSKLVVADSGSTDATHEILINMRERYPEIEIISNTGKQHGPKVLALYNYAINAKADYVFQTDSDGQTVASEFEYFWKHRKEYDAIIGNRVTRQDGTDRKIVEKIVCVLLWIFFKVQIPDANAPFRLMKSSLIQKYLYELPDEYNLPNIMLTTFFVYNHEKIQFKKISFKSRQGGENSINIPQITRIGWQAIRDWTRIRRRLLKNDKFNS